MIILGLVILVAAVIAGVAGVLGNSGSAHALGHGFSVFGYHMTGSSGTVFLSGIVVGVVGLLGLSVLLVGARRTSRRGRAARRRLQQSRRETAVASQDRADLINQRDTARAETARALGNGAPPSDHPATAPEDGQADPGNAGPEDSRRSRWQVFGHRSAPRQATAADPESLAGQPTPDVPADEPVPAE